MSVPPSIGETLDQRNLFHLFATQDTRVRSDSGGRYVGAGSIGLPMTCLALHQKRENVNGRW
jgi:hypothetical protein